MQFVDKAINHMVTDVIDVDGVVQKIEINKVLDKVDIDELVKRIDMNALLSTIDWDEQLQRVDFNAILQRVDTNAIIAKSSTGIFSNVIDSVRTTIVLIDLYLWVVSRCNLWCKHRRQRCYLPPKPPTSKRPGYRQRDDQLVYPKGRANKAVAVQGRFCGYVSKVIATMIDVFTITILFGALFQIVTWSMVLFLKDSQEEANDKTSTFKENQAIWTFALYCAYWFLYFFLSVALTGRTFGMILVGIRVVNCRKGSRHTSVGPWQAFIRSCLLPITYSLPLGWPLSVIGLYRRDGKMLHDLIAQTGVIYLWDAKMAQARHKAFQLENGSSFISNDDDSDVMDEYYLEDPTLVGQEVVLGQQQEGESGMWYWTFDGSNISQRSNSGSAIV